ncbi:MAG: hypothetical protein GF329_13115 [Candidatus Lokiarchaeota archaeon]|nr:hypothetical protein [Candidatus Lokiarchaeota archaeon]
MDRRIMKRLNKILFCFTIISLLILIEVNQAVNYSKIMNQDTDSENPFEIVLNSYSDPPRKPFTLKNLMQDLQNVTSPTANDTDNDGIEDPVERAIGTNPNETDTDLDGLDDYNEIYNGSDPLNTDSNEDGFPDYYELTNVTIDFDGDGINNIWDFDNDGDGVNDGFDLSPFANSTSRDHYTFDIITDGKPLNINFQIVPEDSDRLKLFYQTWDWPHDDEGDMQDLDDSIDDVHIIPWLRVTPNVLPEEEKLSGRGIIIRDDAMDIGLNPTFDQGDIVAFRGNFFYPETIAMNLNLKIELMWEILGDSDKVAKSILAPNGKYICIGEGNLLTANTTHVNYENRSLFQWIELGEDEVALKSPNGGFIRVEDNGTLSTQSAEITDRETFQIEEQGSETGFKAYNDKFLVLQLDGLIMADKDTFEGYEVKDQDYFPDTIHLVNYKDNFKVSGFNLEENFGCNLSLFYNETKNQTIAANMLLTYDFLRNSTTTLSDMSSILQNNNVSVNSTKGIFMDIYEAFTNMSNEMMPDVLDSLSDDQIHPIIIATEENSKKIDMYNIIEKYGVLGASNTINMTEESIITTKSLKTEYYNLSDGSSYYNALDIEEILDYISSWELDENATRTLMMMTVQWYTGETIITSIGDDDLDFSPPENDFTDTVNNIAYIGLNSLSFIVTEVLSYHAFKSLRFSYMTLAYKGGKAVLSNWQVYKIVRRTNPSVIKSLKMNRMLAVIRSGGKFGKATSYLVKSLQTIAKYGKILDIIGIFIGVGISIWAGIEIAESIGGTLGKELGAAYGIAGSLWAIVSGLILMAMFTNPVTAVLAMILIILDLIFDISSKVVEWFAGVIFGSPHDYHHAEPYLDIEGNIEPDIKDYDSNGLDVGDRIEILAHLIGGITGHGTNKKIEDRSYVIPYLSIDAPSGTDSDTGDSGGSKSSSLLTQTQTGSTGGNTLEDKYDSIAWIEPGIGMINFPVKLKLNSKYKLRNEWYHRPWWYFGAKCWHKSWVRGTMKPQDISTLYFDVLPKDLNDFLNWGSISVTDIDGDGISDFDEEKNGDTNMFAYDSDGDGLNDKYEKDYGTEPKKCDTDEDGLLDGHEAIYGANATNRDSDNDGIYDFLEIAGWLISFNYSGHVFTTRVYSDPANNDTDGDGIGDGTEYWSGLNPRSIDTNGDGELDIAKAPAEIIAILKNSTLIEQNLIDDSCKIAEFAVDDSGNIYAPVINKSDNSYFMLKLENNLSYSENWSLSFKPGKVGIDDGLKIIYIENITEPGTSYFVRYDLNGTILNDTIGLPLGGIMDIDIDDNNNLYIARNRTDIPLIQIEKYDKNGTLIINYSSYGPNPNQFTNLTSISVDSVYEIIYAIDDHRVMKFNISDGSFLTTLPNGYQNMVDIETDGDGWVYVLDQFDEYYGEGCIRKFDHNGMEDINFILTNSSVIPPWYISNYPIRFDLDVSKNVYVLENKTQNYTTARFLKFKENETNDPPEIDNDAYDWDGDEFWNLRETLGWNITFRYNPWVTIHVNSSAFLKDTDFDGLDDIEDFNLKSNPRDPDTDGDGLSDSFEYDIGTDILNFDTDDDGLNDSAEVLFKSNPINKSDTEDDGLSDLIEFSLQSNPNSNDTDHDNATDLQEYLGNSSLLNPDTDGDFMFDGLEYQLSCDPNDNDTDDDYLFDGEELFYETNPTNNDTDLDKLIDGMEVDLWLNPLSNDTDEDNLSDYIELEWGSNPHVNDTDFDGVPDEDELMQTNFTKEIFVAYDTDSDNKTGDFVEKLAETANVTVVSITDLLVNHTDETYIVLIGAPKPQNTSSDNITVGNLIYELLLDTGSELEDMMKNESNHIAIRHGLWTNEQTIVMLPRGRFLDIGKVIKNLKDKNITISPNKYKIEYKSTPILHSNDTFYYGITVDEIDTLKMTDSIVSIIFKNWSLPTIQTIKYNRTTTQKQLNYFNGLRFGDKLIGKYLDFNVDANASKIQSALVIIYYKESELDLNNNGYTGDFSDIQENGLSLYYYNETTNKWIKISLDLDWIINMGINTTDCVVYGEQYSGFIWIETTHLSLFALVGYQNVPFWDIYYYVILAGLILMIFVAYEIGKRRRETVMDNIKYQIDNKNLIIRFNHKKEFGRSSSGKTIIVANSHGTKKIPETDLYLNMIVYKYPEPKKTKRKKEYKMQNISVNVEERIVKLTIDMEKDFGLSSSGKTIIVASSRGNKPIGGTSVFCGINVYKKNKKIPKQESKIDQQDQLEIKKKEIKTKQIKNTEPKNLQKESKNNIAKSEEKKSKKKPMIVENNIKIDSRSERDEKSKEFTLGDIPGIGEAKIDLLNTAGIKSVDDLINCDPKEISEKVKGLGIKSLKKWIDKAKDLKAEFN